MRVVQSVLVVIALAALAAAGCDDDLGSSSAALSPSAAGGNSACAECCKLLFPPGRARGQCVADGAHHTGACWFESACCVLDMSVPATLPDLAGTD